MSSRSFSRVAVILSSIVAVCAVSIAPAASEGAGAAGRASVGSGRAVAVGEESDALIVARDVSFPQCGGRLPQFTSGDFGVIGTNNGISFTRNPCLVRQLGWAKHLRMPPAFYANTGNPGPQRASHWPLGQTSPRVCAAADPNSIACSYDYGWNAAWHSYGAATDAAQRLHHVDRANARRRAANVDWWLDVETMNSWQSIDGVSTRGTQRRDAATIEGEIDALRFAGVDHVGVYSTAFQWDLITGGAAVTGGRFAGVAQWLAGYASQADAVAGCGDRGFTGGSVRMTQYLARDGYDADVVCAAAFGT